MKTLQGQFSDFKNSQIRTESLASSPQRVYHPQKLHFQVPELKGAASSASMINCYSAFSSPRQSQKSDSRFNFDYSKHTLLNPSNSHIEIDTNFQQQIPQTTKNNNTSSNSSKLAKNFYSGAASSTRSSKNILNFKDATRCSPKVLAGSQSVRYFGLSSSSKQPGSVKQS